MSEIRYMTAEKAGKDAVRLAAARQQIAADNANLPTWDELADDERVQSTVAAGWWLEAAKDAGLVPRQSVWPPAALVASLRLAQPGDAVDPAVHTPERVTAYLRSLGFAERHAARTRAIWARDVNPDGFRVHVPLVPSAPDYARRLGIAAGMLADEYGTGEIAILTAIANQNEES